MYCLKNEQESIIRFNKLRQTREFLRLIIYDCDFFERLQNLWYSLYEINSLLH